jgi:hypothetical protein
MTTTYDTPTRIECDADAALDKIESEPCGVEWCGHVHGLDDPCDVGITDTDGKPGPCGCHRCPICLGYGVIVIPHFWRDEEVERQCPRCDGSGQR